MNTVQIRVVFDRKKQATKTRTGLVQLECRMDGERKFISTGIKLLANQFRDGRAYNHIDADNINMRINERIKEINLYIDTFNRSRIKFKLKMLDNINGTYYQNTFLSFFEQRIKERPIKESTKAQHRKVLNFLNRYGKIVEFTDLTLPNIKKMDEYLHTVTTPDGRKLLQPSIHVYHKVLKHYINESIEMEIINDNPYSRFKSSQGQSRPREVLTLEELELIKNYKTRNLFLEKIRSLFIVQCYTGLAYADLMAVDWTQAEEVNGQYIIRHNARQKTGTHFTIFILPPVLKILKKYHWHLPKLAYDVYNRNLKMFAVAVGIKKTVTTHIGRHTFATTSALGSGVPMEVVSKMLGHTDIKTTQIYAKIMPTQVIDGFKKIEDAI